MNTWLVTGAAGLLGANAGVFLQSRANAVGMARGVAPRTFPELRMADLRDASAVSELVTELKPDVILHAAALSRHEDCERDPDLARLVNVEGTRAIAKAATTVGSKLVYISTDAVFDGGRGRYSEEDLPQPFSQYGQTKLDGERVALDSTDALIVRTNFFGWSPSGCRSILEFFLNELSEGRAVPGYTDFTVSSMYVQSLLQDIWDLVERDVSGLIHVASHDALTKYEFAQALAEEFGVNGDLVLAAPAPAQDSATRGNRDISMDVSKCESLLARLSQTQRSGLAAAHMDAAIVRNQLKMTSG